MSPSASLPPPSPPDPQFELRPLASISEAEQVALLGGCFDMSVDPESYRWKNVEGAWGPSHGIIAVDATGPAAILLCLPWRVQAGKAMTVSRMVDGGTLERARRRGLFRAMVMKWADEQRATDLPLAFGVANDAAAVAHGQAGATLTAIPHAYSLALPAGLRPARSTTVSVADAAATYPPTTDDLTLSTVWTPDALVWRFDPRSGHDYRAALLGEADSATGIIYRIQPKSRTRVLVRVLGWGDDRAQAQLLASAARAERTPVTLDVAGHTRAPRLQRGQSWLCTWTFAASPDRPPPDLATWAPSLADLEAVI